MAKPPMLDDPQAQTASLPLAEKILMFSIASHTAWEQAGITGTTVIAMMVKQGHLEVHSSLLSVVLSEQPNSVTPQQ
jgi:hypothetical protein